MNVLIADLDKVDCETLYHFVKAAKEVIGDDFIVLPKGVDILQDVPVEWLKEIRDGLDEKIKALENNTK